jgi:hypothetical protein
MNGFKVKWFYYLLMKVKKKLKQRDVKNFKIQNFELHELKIQSHS